MDQSKGREFSEFQIGIFQMQGPMVGNEGLQKKEDAKVDKENVDEDIKYMENEQG